MLSGGGRTVLNLLDHIERGELHAQIALVISSSESALGVQRCRDRGLIVEVMAGVIPADTLGAALHRSGIDGVVLAGYLKLLRIPPAYRGRIVNIHPALLPKFGGKGMHGDFVHQAVIAAGETQTGCTVHLVDDAYDTGKVLLQRRCAVLKTDDVPTLAARVFDLECAAYPEAVKGWLAGLDQR